MNESGSSGLALTVALISSSTFLDRSCLSMYSCTLILPAAAREAVILEGLLRVEKRLYLLDQVGTLLLKDCRQHTFAVAMRLQYKLK